MLRLLAAWFRNASIEPAARAHIHAIEQRLNLPAVPRTATCWRLGGGASKRAAVGKTYPAVGTFFHGILFFPARTPFLRPAAPLKIDAT